MLYHGKFRYLFKPCELIHLWGQEDWFQCGEDMIFQGSVYSGVFSKQRLVLLKFFSSKRFFLGAPHDLWLVAWVVRRHKRKSCLFHVLLGRHCQREVSKLASSEVPYHGLRIPADQLMYIDQPFSCRFSVNIWMDGRQEIREDSLDAVCCPHRFVLHSCCA